MPKINKIQKEIQWFPIPGKRSQKAARLPGNKIIRRCYAPHNPHYFMDSAGKMHPINLDHRMEGVAKDGDPLELISYNVVSVGRKTNKNKEKYLGLRPDFCQDLGTEQLEFSFISLDINGEEIDFDIEDLEIISTRQRCRQLIPATSQVKSFRAEFKIYLEGLRANEKSKLNEYWILTKQLGGFRFRIRKPVLLDSDYCVIHPDPETGKPDPSEYVRHSLSKNKDGSYTYIKESLPGFEKLELPEKFWIDADIYYSESSDCALEYYQGYPWSVPHDATDATSIDTTSAQMDSCIRARAYAGPLWTIGRVALAFDISGHGTVTAVDLCITQFGNTGEIIYVQKGTQADSPTTADYDSFTGSAYDSILWTTGLQTFTFDATGISDVDDAVSLAKVFLRESSDYEDDSNLANDRCGMCFSENAADPYLSIIQEAPANLGGMFFCKPF